MSLAAPRRDRPRARPPARSRLVRTHAWSIGVWVAMARLDSRPLRNCPQRPRRVRVGRFDLGNMVQAVWSTTTGPDLENTQGIDRRAVSRLGAHADPFLALLAPLWLVWPSPLSLAFAQIFVVSLGALPVFWLGRRHLGTERVAGLLALGYLATRGWRRAPPGRSIR